MGSVKSTILCLMISLLIVWGFLLFLTSDIKNTLDYCDENNWDGSTYDTGKRGTFDKETIKVKCNRQYPDTDIIESIVNTLYFWEGFNG